MRTTAVVAGLALLAAACGGGGDQPGDQAAQPAAEAAAPPAAGATHDVNMVLEGTAYRFVPERLTIRAGDVVRFHNVSGGPHNVQFWPDSIPAGAQAVLDAAMADQIGVLTGPLLTEPNAVYSVSFAGAPAGEYRFTCTPHLAMGMNGSLTVQP
jgi:plastocyanin